MKRNILVLAMALFGLVLMSTTAGATPVVLSLSDGVTSVIVSDGDILDLNPAAGAVTYIGAIGIWTLNVSTAIGFPAAGSPANPQPDLNSVNISSGAGTLLLSMSQGGYTPSPGGFVFGIGGTAGGSISALGCANADCAALGPFGPGAFSGSTAFAFPDPGGEYGFLILAAVTHLGEGTSSFNAELDPIPEPGTYALMGLGLAALAFVKRRRA